MPKPGEPTAYGWSFERHARPMRAAAVETPCPLCGVTMGRGRANPAGVTVDHIVPVALGGTHDRSNLRVMCRSCNCSLGGKLGRAREARRRSRVIARVSASRVW